MNAELLAHVFADARANAGATLPGAEAGQAFVIQVEPDLVAGERINVGVGVVSADGKRLARFLTDFGRLDALYGRDVAELIEVLADFARAAALSGDVLSSPSVHFTSPQPFFGMPPEQYLDQLFARVVPAAAPRREQGESEAARDTDQLWRVVGDAIKLRLPDRAQEIIANTPWTTVETPRGPRPVCVPLQPRGGAGALESADWSAAVTENKLMRALLDIETAATVKRLDKLGMFIALPRRSRKDVDLKAINKAIDFVACRVPPGCRVEVEADAVRLASHIIHWADLQAA